MPLPLPRRPRQLLALVAVAGLLVGCGQEVPGVAATVDGERIAFDRVDAYASAVCEYGRTSADLTGQEAQPLSGADLRGFVLDLFVSAELTDQVAEQVGASVPPSAGTSEPDAATRQVIAAMPEQAGERIADLYALNQRTLALRRAIGVRLLSDQGSEGTADEADSAADTAIARAADRVEIDPRLAADYALRNGVDDVAQEAPLAVAAGDPGAQSAVTGCS